MGIAMATYEFAILVVIDEVRRRLRLMIFGLTVS